MSNRLVQCDEDGDIKSYFIRDEINPCGCGSNCYHHQYDKKSDIIYCVCNACNLDIYTIKKQYKDETLNKDRWLELQK